jgi:hypothetical protein
MYSALTSSVYPSILLGNFNITRGLFSESLPAIEGHKDSWRSNQETLVRKKQQSFRRSHPTQLYEDDVGSSQRSHEKSLKEVVILRLCVG